MDGLDADEERLVSLMSKLRLRDVNPADYDGKMKYWTQAIRRHCDAGKRAVFTLAELGKVFTWKDCRPACLDTVLLEMVKNGDAQTRHQFEAATSGWLEWGYSMLAVGLWKRVLYLYTEEKDPDEEQYVIIDAIKSFADKIFELRKSAKCDSPLGQCVVTLTCLRECVADICADEETLMLVIRYMRHTGALATGENEKGEVVLKFRMPYERSFPKITDCDLSVLKLQEAVKKLEGAVEMANSEIDRLDTEARKCLADKNRASAMRCLRQKHIRMKRLEQLENSLANMVDMLHRLMSAADNQLVVDALQRTSFAFKGLMKKESTLEKAYEVIDEVQQVIDDQAEMDELLSSPLPKAVEDEEDLEEELAAILKAEEDKEAKKEEPTLQPLTPEIAFVEKPVKASTKVEEIAS